MRCGIKSLWSREQRWVTTGDTGCCIFLICFWCHVARPKFVGRVDGVRDRLLPIGLMLRKYTYLHVLLGIWMARFSTTITNIGTGIQKKGHTACSSFK